MCIECRLRVPVRVGYVRCTYFVNKPLNNDQYHRAHNSHSTRTQHMHKEKMMARREHATCPTRQVQAPSGRTDGRRLLSGPCWQLGDRRLCRWRNRPCRGSDLRGGCSALEPRGGRGARPPRAGPAAIGSAVRRRRRARHHRASGRAAIDAAPRAPTYSTAVAGATATAAAAAAW